MDTAEKQRRVGDYAWYHTVDLEDGVITPGQYDHRPLLPHYGLPDDLTGKTALDVGPRTASSRSSWSAAVRSAS